jgi:hypothetical protein
LEKLVKRNDNIKRKIDEMYQNVSNRPVELVFFDKRLKKSIGLRKPPSDFLRELDDEFDDENTLNKKQ